jgi:hypothetical protein
MEAMYLHRARREDSLGALVGRDALIADDLALAALGGSVAVEAAEFVRDVATLTVTVDGKRGEAVALQHRWAMREGARVLREVVVADRLALATAMGQDIDAWAREIGANRPAQPPLGELRSGRGQLGAGDRAWGCKERPRVADALHRIWNGRCLDGIVSLYAEDVAWSGPGGRMGDATALRRWLTRLLARLPDATLVLEDAREEGGRVALLWRLFAHEGGVRMRLVVSQLLTMDGDRIVADETLLDELALEATRHRPLLAIRR